MKVITWETLYYEDHGATLKHKCGKRIVTLSLLSFSLIFLGLLFFYGLSLFWGLLFFMAFLFFIPHLGQCSNNDDHHTSIYLQLNDYNSILEQRWLYMIASGGVPGCVMSQERHVWKNYERWLCHKYDVNYMIMQSNMTMMKRVIITEQWKVAWQYILEWLWKCHNGRYGDCFEKGIWWFYGTGESCAVLERLAMVEGWECV